MRVEVVSLDLGWVAVVRVASWNADVNKRQREGTEE